MAIFSSSVIVVGFVIILTGALGGIRNWVADENGRTKAKLAKRVLDGIMAASTVPLFLSIVGSEKAQPVFGSILILDAKYQEALFILVGFCSVASVYSERFLDSLSRKVMQLNDKMDKVAEKVEEAKAITELQIETDMGDRTPAILEEAKNLPDKELKLLKALGAGQFLMRSIQGLAQTTHFESPEVIQSLARLAERGFVRQLSTAKGERWAITDEGRAASVEGSNPN